MGSSNWSDKVVGLAGSVAGSVADRAAGPGHPAVGAAGTVARGKIDELHS